MKMAQDVNIKMDHWNKIPKKFKKSIDLREHPFTAGRASPCDSCAAKHNTSVNIFYKS